MPTDYTIYTLLVLLLIYSGLRNKARFAHTETITINQPVDSVFNYLMDLSQWKSWSPWLMHEPQCTLSLSDNPVGENASFSWDGVFIGSGSMTIESSIQNPEVQQILLKLFFKKPFRSQADVCFFLRPISDNSTQVEWQMHSRMSGILFWLVPRIKKQLHLDFYTGLNLLASRMNATLPPFELTFNSQFQQPELNYQSVQKTVQLPTDSLILTQSANNSASNNEQTNANQTACVFFPSQITNPTINELSITKPISLAGEVGEITDTIQQSSTNTALETLPQHRCLQVIFSGTRQQLQTAWRQAWNHLNMQKLKPHKQLKPYQIHSSEKTDKGTATTKVQLYIPLAS